MLTNYRKTIENQMTLLCFHLCQGCAAFPTVFTAEWHVMWAVGETVLPQFLRGQEFLVALVAHENGIVLWKDMFVDCYVYCRYYTGFYLFSLSTHTHAHTHTHSQVSPFVDVARTPPYGIFCCA